ncbi:MAG: hypothetical protein ACR2OZ_08330 [Verrucomicrobiales bacterium]
MTPPGRDKREGTFHGMYLGGDESLPSREWIETNGSVAQSALTLMTVALTGLRAEQSVTVWIERAPSLNGPWTKLDLQTATLDPNGNPRLPVNTPGEFYRTRIALDSSAQLGDPIALAEVPAEFRTRAEDFLRRRIAGNPAVGTGEEEGWPQEAQLGPHVMPMHAMAADGSVMPAYFEFKFWVVHAFRPKGVVVDPPGDSRPEEAGYILCRPRRMTFPLPNSATLGKLPSRRWRSGRKRGVFA